MRTSQGVKCAGSHQVEDDGTILRSRGPNEQFGEIALLNDSGTVTATASAPTAVASAPPAAAAAPTAAAMEAPVDFFCPITH